MTTEVEQAIVAIIRQGKEPSLAQIKSKLSNSLAMKEIITALQVYKRSPAHYQNLAIDPAFTIASTLKQSDQQLQIGEQFSGLELQAQYERLQKQHQQLQDRVLILEQQLKSLLS